MSDTEDELDDLERDLEESSTSGGPKLTAAEWEEVKTKWRAGTHRLSDLATEYGVRADNLQKRLKSHGIERGSEASIVGDAVADELAAAAAENARRIHETKEDHYKFAKAIGQLVMGTLITAKSKNAIGRINPEMTVLGKAAKTLEIIRKERYALLGLDKEDGDPDDVPELLISEMSDEQVAALQASLRGENNLDNFDADLDASFDDDDLTDNDVVETE